MDIVKAGFINPITNEKYEGECDNCGCIAKFFRHEGTYGPGNSLSAPMVTVKCPTEGCSSYIHGREVK